MAVDHSRFSWRPTGAPIASSRTDDIWFLDENVGWAVNSNGQILKTEDGGDSWTVQANLPSTYLRCIGFANADVGWVGSLTPENRLFHTKNGGGSWQPVTNLPEGTPARICGLSVVNASTVYASGTNDPAEKAAVIKTVNGGESWTAIDLDAQAALLVDIYFKNQDEGWVVGGEDRVGHPNRATDREDVIPTVLHTTDGGRTWTNVVRRIENEFPRGEWGWKIQSLDGSTMFVSLENFRDGAILRSDDGGTAWRRLRINDRQRNSNLEGVGFLNRDRGWAGGWGDLNFGGGFTSQTGDGGSNWDNANEVGFRLNRFRFIGDPVRTAYASGDTIYKFSEEPVRPIAAVARAEQAARVLEGERLIALDIDVPQGAAHLLVQAWDRFGRRVRVLADEQAPPAGPHPLTWDFTDASSAELPTGGYIVRITIDDHSQSRVVYRIA